MPIKHKKTGTGITEREVTEVTAPFGEKEIAEVGKLFSREFTFEGLYGKRAEVWAREVLVDADLDPGENLEHFHTVDYLQRLTSERVYSTEVDYAARVLQALKLVRTLMEHGDVEDVARFAVELGLLLQEMAMKFKWEGYALSGQKRAEDLRSATARWNQLRAAEAAEIHEKWLTRAKPVWAKHRTWGALKVAETIAEPHESPDYIRQIISSVRPSTK